MLASFSLMAASSASCLFFFHTEEKREQSQQLSATLEISIMKSLLLFAHVNDINCHDSLAQQAPEQRWRPRETAPAPSFFSITNTLGGQNKYVSPFPCGSISPTCGRLFSLNVLLDYWPLPLSRAQAAACKAFFCGYFQNNLDPSFASS